METIKINEEFEIFIGREILCINPDGTNYSEYDYYDERDTRKIPIINFGSLLSTIGSKRELLTDDLMYLIEFMEVLRGFSANKLNPIKTYSFGFFTAKVQNQDNNPILSIYFNEYDYKLTYDKVEAQILFSKINKVVYKCEVV